MSGNNLSIANVINVSVATPQSGLGKYSPNNLAIFTRDTPDPVFSSGYKIYLSPTEVADDFGTGSATYSMANAVFSQQPNILAGGGYLVVIPFTSMETIDAAITRTKNLVEYFGIMCAELTTTDHMLAAAAVVQALNKIAFWFSYTPADIDPGGMLDQLTTGGFTKNRGLYYGNNLATALVMMASYAALGMSVNFDGSNTTLNMHMKTLSGVQPDPNMTQTLLNKAIAAGADTYVSIQGVPKVFCSGANVFFDRMFNLGWFVGAVTVAAFNVLAQNSTKIPQTESGMDILRGAVRQVCQQAVTNQFSAPGAWTNPVTFGNQQDLYLNVSQYGYYIYSTPIAQQSPASRADREAPLVQVALKEAGAIDSASIVINVNA